MLSSLISKKRHSGLVLQSFKPETIVHLSSSSFKILKANIDGNFIDKTGMAMIKLLFPLIWSGNYRSMLKKE